MRFSYVLGEGDKFTSMLCAAADHGETVSVFDGFERNIVVLDDVLEGIKNLIEDWHTVSSSIINFAGPNLVSRATLTSLFKSLVNQELEFKVDEAPEGFWNARPKTINMTSDSFSALLGREPTTVEAKFKNWRK